MFSEGRLIGIKISMIVIIVLLSILGMCYIIDKDDYAKPIDYYENGTKIDAIKYHNEIYLKKGE